MMNKTTRKVFALIGTLVAIFLAWQLIFMNGGILKTAYNNIVNGVNDQWEKVAGSGEILLPLWDETGAETGSKADGFDIDTE